MKQHTVLPMSYKMSGLSGGTTYFFAVKAYNALGDTSSLSDEVAATTVPDAPPAVTSLALTSSVASPQTVSTKVTWVAMASGGVGPYRFSYTPGATPIPGARVLYVEDSKVVGIISIGDIVKWRVREYETEQEALREYIKTA